MSSKENISRLFGVAFTVCVALLLGGGLRDYLIFAVGFGHYFTSAIYSDKQYARVFSRAYAVPFVLLSLIGLVAWGMDFSLVYYFGLHHVFNELYLKATPAIRDAGVWRYRAACVVFHLCVYLLTLRDHVDVGALATAGQLAVLTFTSGAWLAFELWTGRKRLEAALLRSDAGFSVFALAALLASYVLEIRFLDVVCYHFGFWLLFPVLKKPRPRGAFAGEYALLTCAATLPFVAMSPLLLPGISASREVFFAAFIFMSYFHITTACAVSSAHPEWIVRWFRSPLGSPALVSRT